MKILARGEKIQTEELKQKLSSVDCDLTVIDDTDLISANLADYDVIFDLTLDAHPEQLKFYAGVKIPVIVSAVKVQLAKMINDHVNPVNCSLIGINALPGFINRSLAEVSISNEKDKVVLDTIMKKLNWEYKLVEDRVGMVTPRIIFMIMNEACYTVQEGTATIQDIDVSMKLGTNYPFGPFEWVDKIGITHVYETLEAVYQDTHDERYKICPLLKTAYLKGVRFYN
jgi:3-hydroxybutyryl-CoA dehydrogenase